MSFESQILLSALFRKISTQQPVQLQAQLHQLDIRLHPFPVKVAATDGAELVLFRQMEVEFLLLQRVFRVEAVDSTQPPVFELFDQRFQLIAPQPYLMGWASETFPPAAMTASTQAFASALNIFTFSRNSFVSK